MKVTALAGGVGGAKTLTGLADVIDPADLTAIVNVGDDAEIYGVHVSPDVDICTYWLAGIADTRRGWGIAGDSFNLVDALARIGDDAWFRLGDQDFAVCVHRTLRLRSGAALSTVTADIARGLGVAVRIVPATDEPLRTMIDTDDGRTLSFQEYFVRERTEPEVSAVRIEGRDAAAAPGVIDALADADLVVVCPSNPILSIDPILAVSGIRAALRAHPRVVAISPIVKGAAIKGPADRLLARLHDASSAVVVARLYADLTNLFVVDERDADLVPEVEALGMRCVALDTMMIDRAASARLAKELITL